MNFIVSSGILLKQLQIIGGVIGNSNNTQPILNHFLFKIEDSILKVAASDLESTISTKITVQANQDLSIAVPAKLLLDILKTFPDQPLTFEVLENYTVKITSTNGSYSLAYASAEEFPENIELEQTSNVVLPAHVLANGIQKTLFATGNDEHRPIMCGVFFQFFTDRVTFVSTDAHKLVKYCRKDLSASENAEFIVPKKPLQIIKGILATDDTEVSITFNQTNAKFTFEDTEIICRLIDGKFPNYEAVIPKNNPNILTMDRNLFLSSVKRISIFSNQATHQINLKINTSGLTIYAEDIDFSNKAEERLECNYHGDPIEIGFNSRFFQEMLTNLNTQNIELTMSSPNRAGILSPIDGLEEGEEITMLVMPVSV